MSETVNTATIKIDVDANGATTGLRSVEESVAKTGKSLETLGATAKQAGKNLDEMGNSSGMTGVGESAGAAATQVDRATARMADSIKRATQATESLSAGAKGTAANFAALAEMRGLNKSALKPLLDQLDAATQKADLAAAAQKKLEDSTKFLNGLKSSTDGIGKSASELAALRAAELGVSEAAAPMIAKMREAEKGAGGMLAAFTPLKVAMAALAAIAAGGALFAHTIKDSIDAAAGMHDMAIQTGASVAALMEFKRIGETSDTGIDTIAGVMNKFAKGAAVASEESKGFGQAVQAIGLNFDKLKAMAPDQQMITIAKALDTFQDGSGKAAVAMTLFGKEGAKLLPFLGDLAAESDNLTKSLSAQEVASKAAMAAMADNFGDNLTLIKQNGAAMRKEISYGMLPGLYEASQAFLDVTSQAGGLKDIVKGLVADGSITRWTRMAVDGLTYVMDAAEGVKRVFVSLGSIIAASMATYSTVINAMIEAGTKVGHADFSGAMDSLSTATVQIKSNFVDLGKTLSDTWGEQTFGAKLRARLDELRKVGTVAGEAKKTLNYDGNDDGGAAAAKKEAEQYAGLIASIRAKSDENRLELATSVAATEGEKLRIKVDQQLASGKLNLSAAHLAVVRAALAELDATEALVKIQKAEKDSAAWIQQSAQARSASNSALQVQYDLYGKSADAREIAMVAIKGETELEKFLLDEKTKGITIGAALEAQLRSEKDARVAVEQATLGQTKALQYASQLEDENKKFAANSIGDEKARAAALLEIDADVWRERISLAGNGTEAQKKIQEQFDTWYANQSTKAAAAQAIKDWQDVGAKISESLSTAFGNAGKSIGEMFKAYSDGQAKQLKAQNDLTAAQNSTLAPAAKAAAIQSAQLDGAQAQVKSYGDMAQAAQGFFDQGSSGYRAMAAASEVLRLAEVGLSLVKGVNAVLTQGEGDPYSAFGRMAAMAAIVAGLGVAIGGIGGGGASPSAKDRQAAQGTGSVLGDASAKSDSISKSLDMVEKNTFQDLAVSSSMLDTLKSIDANIGNFATQLVRSTNVANPEVNLDKNPGSWSKIFDPIANSIPVLGNITAKIATAIFGGKQTLTDSGFTIDPTTLGSAMQRGVQGQSYADITKSGGWFGKDKTSEQTTPFDSAANKQFTDIITSLADSIKQAGNAIGLSGDDFSARLNSFVIDIGNVSLKDLKGDELQKALESVFSKLGDDMAQFAVGGLDKLTKVGEGYLETLTRVAQEYQTVDVVFQSFGKSFGAVGLASVAARDQLVQMAGGLDKFTSAGDYFLKNFFSDQEQADALKKRINPTLAQYGLSTEGDDASKMFRDFIVGLDTTTQAGAQAYTTLMTLAPAFKTVVDAQKDSAKDATKILSDQLDLQSQIYKLTGDKAAAAAVLEKQHALALDALDPSLRDATKQLWSLQAAADAVDKVKSDGSALLNNVDNAYSVLQGIVGREKDLLQKRIDMETDAVSKLKSLSESVHSALNSLSPPGADEVTRTAAQAQIRSALATVKSGSTLSDDDQTKLKEAFTAVTKDSTNQFSSFQDYMKDLLSTQNDIADLGKATDDQLSAQQTQLDLDKKQIDQFDLILNNAKEQVDQLKGISTIGLSIQQAIEGLGTAMLGAKGNASVAGVSAISDAYKTSLGRAPDAAGLDYYQNLAAGGASIDDIRSSISGSREAQIQGLYKQLLGNRTADSGGLDYYMKSGETIAQIAADIKNSDEYKKLHPTIPGFEGGGLFGGGLRIVGENGPELEATGPSRIWNNSQTTALLSRLTSPSDNSAALVAEVKALRDEVALLRRAGEKTAENTGRHADMFDQATAGGGPLLVEMA